MLQNASGVPFRGIAVFPKLLIFVFGILVCVAVPVPGYCDRSKSGGLASYVGLLLTE